MVSTTINTGEILLEVTDPAFILDAARLRALVFDGGATLHQIRLQGSATLARDGEAWTLTFCGSGQRMPAEVPKGKEPFGKERLVHGTVDVPKGTAPFEARVHLLSD